MRRRIARATILDVSTVYILGAGASHGDSLINHNPEAQPHPTPLTNGFFCSDLLSSIGYKQAEEELTDFIAYVGRTKLISDKFGEGQWVTLNLEEVFTAIEVEREFHSPESDAGARLLLLRNALVRFITRVLKLCTRGAHGEYCRLLKKQLTSDDSIITFNWDLLLDREFVLDNGRACDQYGNFLLRIPLMTQESLPSFVMGEGLLLKLHGSLNWFRCGNRKCESSTPITFLSPIVCLGRSQWDEDVTCWQCGSFMNPVIVPPLLRKPITEDPAIRSAWGLARERLLDASRVVVVGFSGAATDFYTSWLLRSTVGTREDVEIMVINPDNREDQSGHVEFRKRMDSIFLKGYISKLHEFSQIASLLGDAQP